MNESHITDKIIGQILEIRSEGKFNMFDTTGVQREAYNKGFHELVLLIKDYKNEYAGFIMTGKRGDEGHV